MLNLHVNRLRSQSIRNTQHMLHMSIIALKSLKYVVIRQNGKIIPVLGTYDLMTY